MRRPSTAARTTTQSARQYSRRAAIRSQSARQLPVVRQIARYQKRWERKSVIRSVRPMTIRSNSQPQFTEFSLFLSLLSLPCAGGEVRNGLWHRVMHGGLDAGIKSGADLGDT